VIYPIDPTGLGGMRFFVERNLPTTDQRVIEYFGGRTEPEKVLPALQKFAMRKNATFQDFLVQTAVNTGGRPVMNTNDWEPGIGEIFEENASYYLVAFEAGSAAADGKLHRVDVKVNRPDVDVRSRSQYYAPEPEKPNSRKATAVSPETAALGKAIGGILPNAGLPMWVTAVPVAVPGQRLTAVAVVLGVQQPIPEAAAKSRMTETTELQTSAFTPEGEPRGTQRHTARVVLRAGSDGVAHYEVLGRIDLPPGRYRLRLAAHNANAAKTGSVFTDLTVPDYSASAFSTTPVILTAVPGRVSAPKDLFSAFLPWVPTSAREFASGDRITAMLRLYQSGQTAVEKSEVSITIRNSQDDVVAKDTRIVEARQFAAMGQQLDTPGSAGLPAPGDRGKPVALTQDRFADLSLRSADVTYAIPSQRLPAGEYLLTFEAARGSTVVRRQVRFKIK
jgi:hypothetical protein